MIDDHHGRTAGRATLLARAMDEIVGTHNPDNNSSTCHLPRLPHPCRARRVPDGTVKLQARDHPARLTGARTESQEARQ